jgi:hypothetical protein
MTRIIKTKNVSPYHSPDAGTHESLVSSFLGITLAVAATEGSLSKMPLALVLAGMVALQAGLCKKAQTGCHWALILFDKPYGSDGAQCVVDDWIINMIIEKSLRGAVSASSTMFPKCTPVLCA